jgi:hypothetical protein
VQDNSRNDVSAKAADQDDRRRKDLNFRVHKRQSNVCGSEDDAQNGEAQNQCSRFGHAPKATPSAQTKRLQRPLRKTDDLTRDRRLSQPSIVRSREGGRRMRDEAEDGDCGCNQAEASSELILDGRDEDHPPTVKTSGARVARRSSRI